VTTLADRIALPRAICRAALVAAILGAASPLPIAAQLFAEAYVGTAFSASTRLRVKQRGAPDISVTADYATRPFEGSPYYAWRIGYWSGGTGWAIGLVHHKLYLDNPPPEIERFEISHGFNLLTLTHGWRWGSTSVRAGGGPVVAHPETVVRGRSTDPDGGPFGGGYYITGPSLQAVVGRYIPLHSNFALAIEGMVSGSRARIPVADGHATVPNFALHVHLGLRFGGAAR
jgi:hypothetical protein